MIIQAMSISKLGYLFLAILIVVVFAPSCNIISKRRDPNVLLIVIDTLRADHLGCYGYEKTTSPQIDRFSKTGVQFQNVYCQMPTTGPSHAAIFTSRYPRNHGVLKNGWILPNTYQTIAETLKKNYYTTSAIVSSFVLSSKFGYSQGFDNYDDEISKEGSIPHSKLGEEHKVTEESEQRADITTRKAVNWIRKNRDDKFFLWVHYYDPHWPYEPPKSYVKDFLKKNMNRNEKIVANYDGEIRFVDDEVGKLLNAVKSLELDSNTLIIIMSDHGEGLGQHGWMRHGMFLYDEQCRIPLIMKFPNVIPENLRINNFIEAIDVAPSILDLLGLESEKGFIGKSFLPMFQGEKPFPFNPVFLERRHYKAGKWGDVEIRGNKFAVREKNFKYIWAPEKDTKELYKIDDDPKELYNVVKEYPNVADKLEQMIILWKKEQEAGKKILEQSIDQKSLDNLQSLGYIE